MRFFQIVVWNTRAQMVHVVETDVASYPLKHFWKFVI